MKTREWPHLLAVFIPLLLLYLATAPRTVVLEDDGLFILVELVSRHRAPSGLSAVRAARQARDLASLRFGRLARACPEWAVRCADLRVGLSDLAADHTGARAGVPGRVWARGLRDLLVAGADRRCLSAACAAVLRPTLLGPIATAGVRAEESGHEPSALPDGAVAGVGVCQSLAADAAVRSCAAVALAARAPAHLATAAGAAGDVRARSIALCLDGLAFAAATRDQLSGADR